MTLPSPDLTRCNTKKVQIGLHCSSTGLSTHFPCCICKAESRLAAEGRPGYRLAEACKRTPCRLVFVRSSETKCRPLLNLRRDNVYRRSKQGAETEAKCCLVL